ncbi:MAG: DUF2589 domain-containing protein [Lachnospiraceae bacterium]|nr:DUF2589 domain-containing protein [Lachnospiraceae bacterium]
MNDDVTYLDELSNDADDEGSRFKESEFIPLDDLVYAPLYALAKSNQHLREHIIDAIKGLGSIRHDGKEETVCLNNLNIAYDQIRQEGEEGYSVDNLQMQVPLLSIVPVTNLNVEKAEIDFSTEVKAEMKEAGKCSVNARICAPEQRESDFLPRVHYKLQVGSIPATEGVMRLTDVLSSNQIAKKLDTTPVAVDGNLGCDEHKNVWQELNMLRAKVKRLKQLYKKVVNMMTEQEQLEHVSHEYYTESTCMFDREKYLMTQSDIANRIMEYQDQIMNMEIELGLERDYE